MKRSTRIASAAVAAAVSFGIAGPAVAGTTHGHEHGHNNGHHQTVKDDKVDKGARQVLRDIENLLKRLNNATKENRLKHLTPEDKADLLANVDADRKTLTELAVDTRAADTPQDLKQVRRDLKDVRPQNYTEVVNLLRFAERLTDKIDALRASTVVGSPEATALNEATVKVVEASDAAVLITAYSDKTDIRAVRALLVEAKVNVDAVDDSVDDETEDEDIPAAA